MSLAPLIVAVVLEARQSSSAFRTFRLGVLTGVVYFTGTLYWLSLVMAVHGGLAMWIAVLLMIGLASYLAMFVGAFAAILGRVARAHGLVAVWWSPVIWVATEWFRAWLGGGFPWVLLGSSQAAVTPVVQLASVTGVYGLSALVALVSAAAAAVALGERRVHRAGAVAVVAGLGAVIAWGAWRVNAQALTTAGTPIRVGLLQGNVPQDAKWNPAFRTAIMDRYIDLSRQAVQAGAQLVVWPEASTPFYFEAEGAMAEPVRRLAAQSKTPFLIGTDEFERGSGGQPDRYYNGAVLVGPDGRTAGTYRKIRLVPFGEYVPFKPLLFFVGPLIEAVSDFTPGRDATIFNIEGSRFSVAICYEAVYADLARTFVAGGSQLLTTITNDAWFGRTSAAFQHFEQAGLRAVEQGRYLVRAANTGISGAVDPYGRPLTRSVLFEAQALTVDVRLLGTRTLYAQLGDLVVWLALAMTGGLWWLSGRRSSRPAPSRREQG